MLFSVVLIISFLEAIQCLPLNVHSARSASNAILEARRGSMGQVMQAANSFAGDVMTVSTMLNQLSDCTDCSAGQIRSMARTGYFAEKDEDDHRYA